MGYSFNKETRMTTCEKTLYILFTVIIVFCLYCWVSQIAYRVRHVDTRIYLTEVDWYDVLTWK